MWAAPVVPLRPELDVKNNELRALFRDGLLNPPFSDLYCGQPRPCLDGIGAEITGTDVIQFMRLRRNGFLEFCTERTLAVKIDQTDCIHAFTVSAILEKFASFVTHVNAILETLGPVALGCSMINIGGRKLFVGQYDMQETSRTPWDQDILDLGHEV